MTVLNPKYPRLSSGDTMIRGTGAGTRGTINRKTSFLGP